MTAAEAAELLAVSPRWLLAEARAGRVAHHRLGRQVRFAPAHIEAILAASLRTTSGGPARRVERPAAVSDAGLGAGSQAGALVVSLPERLHPAREKGGRR